MCISHESVQNTERGSQLGGVQPLPLISPSRSAVYAEAQLAKDQLFDLLLLWVSLVQGEGLGWGFNK